MHHSYGDPAQLYYPGVASRLVDDWITAGLDKSELDAAALIHQAIAAEGRLPDTLPTLRGVARFQGDDKRLRAIRRHFALVGGWVYLPTDKRPSHRQMVSAKRRASVIRRWHPPPPAEVIHVDFAAAHRARCEAAKT